MRDRIRVETLGDPVFNPTTGGSARAVVATHYTGKARVQAARDPSEAVTADEQVTLQRFTISLPLSATGLAPGQAVTVTASADPDLVGRALTVTAVQGGTFVTSRRLMTVDQQ